MRLGTLPCFLELVLGQLCSSHEVAVAFPGGSATFIEGPDDEALAAAAITCGEYAGDIG